MNKNQNIQHHKHSVLILLTDYPDRVSRLIKHVGFWNFSHSSISTSLSNNDFYSFTGKHGFRLESITAHPTYKGQDVRCKLISIPVSERVCLHAKQIISNTLAKREYYSYSYNGLISSYFGLKIKFKNKFTCVDFVSAVLRRTKIVSKKDFKSIKKPDHFGKLFSDHVVYNGSLRNLVNNHLLAEQNFE